MTTPQQPIGDDFLYGSFLDYRQSLNLERWLGGLLQIRRLQAGGRLIKEQIGNAAGHNAGRLFSELRPPGVSEKDFEESRKREKRYAALSEDERAAEMEAESEKLQEAIENGELDIWDNTPRFLGATEAERFVEESIVLLVWKILPACNPAVSWLEKASVNIVALLESESGDQTLRAWQAALLCWDFARIQHEGEPPYKIHFCQQVEEFLGIDGKLESSRLENLGPLSPRNTRIFQAAQKIAERFLPAENANLQAMRVTCGI